MVELDVDLGLLTPRSTCSHIESWGPEESEGEQCSLAGSCSPQGDSYKEERGDMLVGTNALT